MKHVVLLGDSIFDNVAYVSDGEPDVAQQLDDALGEGSHATLLAVDGCTTSDIETQLRAMPADATHVFVSSGGNDALGHLDVLTTKASSFAEVLVAFSNIAESFTATYRAMLETVLSHGVPTGLCTVYYPCFETDDLSRVAEFGLWGGNPEAQTQLQTVAVQALTTFNDVIIREAIAHGLPLLDLRLLFNEDRDYANPIEPSAQGGAKLARSIVEVIETHDFNRKRTEVYAR